MTSPLIGLAAASPSTVKEDMQLLGMNRRAWAMVWYPLVEPVSDWGKWLGMWWGDTMGALRRFQLAMPPDFDGLYFMFNECDLPGDNGDSANMTPQQAAFWHFHLCQLYPEARFIGPNISHGDILTVAADGKRCPWLREYLSELWAIWEYWSDYPEKGLIPPFRNWSHVGFHWYEHSEREPHMGPLWAANQVRAALAESGLTRDRPVVIGEMNAPPDVLGGWLEECIDNDMRALIFCNRHTVPRKQRYALVDQAGVLTARGFVVRDVLSSS